jgi:uncharacterized membrane protein
MLFPSTYAIITNGAEFELLLPTFVLMCYYFFIKGKYFSAVIFGLLGAATSLVSPLIIAILFLIEDYKIKGYFYRLLFAITRFRKTKEKLKSSNYKYASIFFWVGMAVLIDIVIKTTPAQNLIPLLYQSGSTNIGSPSSHDLLSSLLSRFASSGQTKLSYFYQTLGGFLFLPINSPYVVLILPYILFVFYVNNYQYYNILNHYTSLVNAFLFLGLVFNIKSWRFHGNKLRKLMIALVIAMLISFLLYSPFNIGSLENGTVHSELTVTNEDNYLSVAFSLIPGNASVFSQNAFPQLMNRAVFYMPGFYNNQSVDYAVIAPLPIGTLVSQYGGFSPYWAQHFLNNSSYGIFEFVDGVTILKLDYRSSPILYIPLTLNYQIDNYLVEGTQLSSPVYKGICQYFPPGEYKITYLIKLEGEPPNNSSVTLFEYTWNNDGMTLSSQQVSISSLPENVGYLSYSTVQNLTSYEIEYQPNLVVNENGGVLSINLEVISLEIQSMNVMR